MTLYLLEFDQLHFIDFFFIMSETQTQTRLSNTNPVSLMETLNTLHFLFI